MAFPIIIPLLLGATALFALTRKASASETPEGEKSPQDVQDEETLANSAPANAEELSAEIAEATSHMPELSEHEPSGAEGVAKLAEVRTYLRSAFVSKDWQKAVALAIASNSAKTVMETVQALKLAGKDEEAKSLLRVLRDWTLLGKKDAKPTSAKPIAAPVRTVTTSAKPIAAPVRTVTTSAKPIAAPVRTAPATQPKASESLSPAAKQAISLNTVLVNATRANEPRALIKAYQTTNKLVADGMYGPASARTLWNVYGILPPNPLHWPAAPRTGAALTSYRAFLSDIAKTKPAMTGRIATLKANLGK